MFQYIQAAPPDAILGLSEAFRSDPNVEKINLTVGVYQDANGQTPILECVKQAEQRILADSKTKSYLAIDGNPVYDRLVQELLFGRGHEIVTGKRAVTLQTPGGTGAVRVAADFVKAMFPEAQMFMSDPTWPNHPSIFRASGIETQTYRYFDSFGNALDFAAMMDDLRRIPAGNVVLFHPCCHNPTGVDPSAEQWRQVADVVFERGLLPLLDFAYQGFGRGIVEDAKGLHAFARAGAELLVCSSFSKNFGVYSERVGALTLVASNPQTASVALTQLKQCVRANYSNPPAHGAAIVATVLGDDRLRSQWEEELAEMRNRIHGMRRLFCTKINQKQAKRDFSFIQEQQGMFSFTGLSADQVRQLREEKSIYIIGNGRINVAGITEPNVDRLTDAICDVL